MEMATVTKEKGKEYRDLCIKAIGTVEKEIVTKTITVEKYKCSATLHIHLFFYKGELSKVETITDNNVIETWVK